VPQWRAVDLKNFPDRLKDATKDGPPIRKSPLTLLGWALHMVQDVTQVYHTYREGLEGHQEFEDDVDEFIQAGNGDRLPSDTSKASLEVSMPKAFVEAVASETRQTKCCPIRAEQLDMFIEDSLNRAIIYSAKLLSFYFRQYQDQDQYLVGDWDGDGKANLAVRRGNCVYMDTNFDGVADIVQCYGDGK
jgi:hypothetical protein